jgi:hypothetical protein
LRNKCFSFFKRDTHTKKEESNEVIEVKKEGKKQGKNKAGGVKDEMNKKQEVMNILKCKARVGRL